MSTMTFMAIVNVIMVALNCLNGNVIVSNLGTLFNFFFKLSSSETSEREWACSSLCNIILEEPVAALKIMKEHGYIHTILALLKDPEPLVSLSALSLVRNITSVLDMDMSHKILDLLDYFVQLLINTNVQNEDDAPAKRYKNQTIENILTIFTYLIMIREELANHFNVLGDFYTNITKVFKLGYSDGAKISSAQLLLTIIESLESKEPVNLHKQHIALLKGSMANQTNSPLLRSLLIAIVAESVTTHDEIPVLLKSSLPIMQQILTWDGKQELLNAQLKAKEQSTLEKPVNVKSLLKDWTDQIEAQCVVLETLANILVDDEEEAAGFVEMDMEEFEGQEDHQGLTLSPDVMEILEKNYGFFQLLAQKTHFVDHFTATSEELLLVQLQARALACFQNFLTSCVFNSNPEFAKDLQEIWNMNCVICSRALNYLSESSNNEDLIQIVSSTTTIMVYVLKFALQYKSEMNIDTLSLSESDIQGIIGILHNPLCDENIRSNAASMLSSVGQTGLLVENIGQVLIQCLDDASLWVVAEAANSIMDVFAEPTCNQIVKSLNMIGKLKELVPRLRSKIKNEAHLHETILLDRIDETSFNLSRFIKYKESQ